MCKASRNCCCASIGQKEIDEVLPVHRRSEKNSAARSLLESLLLHVQLEADNRRVEETVS